MSYSKQLISSSTRRLASINTHRVYSSMPIANTLRVNCIDKMNDYCWRNGSNTNDLHLQKINVNDAKQLFEKEKHRLPKDLDIFINNNNQNNDDHQVVLKINKLNQESTITLQLKESYDLNRDERFTDIITVSKQFTTAHRPIETAIEGTLKHYIGRLQQCIDKQSVIKQ